MRHLSWSISRTSSGTAGSFLKAYELLEGVKYYYKVSNFDTVRGVYGHESINEIVAQNVADILGIPHLRYELLHGDIQVNGRVYETWLTRSRDFKRPGEHKLTFETYYEMAGLEQSGQYRLAPVFDNGLSLLFSCYQDGEAMRRADIMKDGPVNNYVGSRSLTENLRLVPSQRLRKVRAADFTPEKIFAGLQGCERAVPDAYWEMIPAMLRERVGYIETVCN